MGHIRETFHVDAPVEECWTLSTDLRRATEWQSGLVEIKDVIGSPDKVGSQYTPVFRLAGRTLDGQIEVTRAEKPNLLETRARLAGGGKGTATTRFAPAGSGTDVTVELDYDLPGGLFGDIADKLFMERQLEREIKHSNETYKALLEAKVPAHV